VIWKTLEEVFAIALTVKDIIKMKFGFRIPSITKRIAARTSVKRVIRHNLGFKAPRGMGWITDPKKALYNKVYNKTSRGCLVSFVFLLGVPITLAYTAWKYLAL
jgi:hypothetical protein